MKKHVCLAILAMGFSGLVAEILLLRELLVVFSGNELCIGIILSNWLILEAFGCFFPGRAGETSGSSPELFSIITILFSLSLPATVFLTRILKSLIGVSIGESIGLFPMFYSSFLLLAPVSILHGALFTISCRIYSMRTDRNVSSAGNVYVYESFGTIIGGIVCTYLLIPYLNTFQASLGIAMLNFVACLVLLSAHGKKGVLHTSTVAVLCVLIVLSCSLAATDQVDKLHHYSIETQWKKQNIKHYQNSRYSNICVVENEGQYIFFLDGIPEMIIPIPDIPFVEEFVHFPLFLHPDPEKLLILSGGAGGIINEVLKHPSIESIEYAELDPLILDLFRKYPTPLTESELNNKKVNIEHIDGRLFLNTTRNTYDLILVGITEPTNLQANRFFTKEFFALVKTKLNKGGILVFGLPGSLTYLNDELKNLNSCIFHTLKHVFSTIRVIPGDGNNLFLASDTGDISSTGMSQMMERLSRRNIKAHSIAPWHIEKKLHPGWQSWFSQLIEGSSQKINYDFRPVGMFYSIAHWNSVYAPKLRLLFKQFERISLTIIVLTAVGFLLPYYIFRTKIVRFFRGGIALSIMTTGFAGMIFDLMLIFTFQSIYGYVFSWIGLLVTFFIAGAAFGAMVITAVMERIKNRFQLFNTIDRAIICFAVGWPLMFHGIHAHMGNPGMFLLFRVLILFTSFICGTLIGSQFPLATCLYQGENTRMSRTAGLLYASDLLGGFFGGIAGAVVLLPVLGLTGTCITVGVLKLTSNIVISTQPARP